MEANQYLVCVVVYTQDPDNRDIKRRVERALLEDFPEVRVLNVSGDDDE